MLGWQNVRLLAANVNTVFLPKSHISPRCSLMKLQQRLGLEEYAFAWLDLKFISHSMMLFAPHMHAHSYISSCHRLGSPTTSPLANHLAANLLISSFCCEVSPSFSPSLPSRLRFITLSSRSFSAVIRCIHNLQGLASVGGIYLAAAAAAAQGKSQTFPGKSEQQKTCDKPSFSHIICCNKHYPSLHLSLRFV